MLSGPIITALAAGTCYLLFSRSVISENFLLHCTSCFRTRRSTKTQPRTISMAHTNNGRVFSLDSRDRLQWRLSRMPVPSEILFYDYHNEVSRIRLHGRTSVAVFVNGACRGNGTARARAAFGVSFAEDSPYNWNGCLPDWASHTNQVAEIFAAQRAVEIIANDLGEEVCRDGVVIITDSAYLFRAMTSYIYGWVKNGFLDAHGRQLVNGCAFAMLHKSICDLEEKGLSIRFWKVDRAHVHDADRLANYSLDAQPRLLVKCYAVEEVHNSIWDLEEKGPSIRFCKVDRAHVHDADRLADHSLDELRLLFNSHAFQELYNSLRDLEEQISSKKLHNSSKKTKKKLHKCLRDFCNTLCDWEEQMISEELHNRENPNKYCTTVFAT